MKNKQTRFYILDVARGMAALGVLVWHFQHFYYIPGAGLPDTFVRSSQPFYTLLRIFYEYGYFAVQFFFVLSGFIFFWLYLDKIKTKSISAGKFFWLRFSRLYPLHFLTLIAVLVLQVVLYISSGNTYVYGNTDTFHFVLNLFLINYWGFNDGYSFNGPSWSISMEIIAYFIFFLFARIGHTKLWHIVTFLFLAVTVFSFNQSYITQVIFCFFMGGVAYHLYSNITNRVNKLSKMGIISSLLVLCVLGMTNVTKSDSVTIFNITTTHINLAIYGLAFPSLVLALALLQDVAKKFGRKLRFIGDISYSVYLIHFPTQLLLIGAYGILGYSIEPGKKLFIVFIATTIVLATLVYKLFEMPMQRYLRSLKLSTLKEWAGTHILRHE